MCVRGQKDELETPIVAVHLPATPLASTHRLLLPQFTHTSSSQMKVVTHSLWEHKVGRRPGEHGYTLIINTFAVDVHAVIGIAP